MDNRNQPAFPVSNEMSDKSCPNEHFNGLSKREWLAGMAMQGLISKTHPDGMTIQDFAAVMEDSVKIADSLLYELSKPQP